MIGTFNILIGSLTVIEVTLKPTDIAIQFRYFYIILIVTKTSL